MHVEACCHFYSRQLERSCRICCVGRFKEEAQNLIMDIEKSNPVAINLNESQHTAVVSSMATRRCQYNHSVQLIWGPPGTGKTNTIATLLLALLASKSRVMTCAPTNVAVVRVASRLRKLGKLRPSRADELCRLGDMVLMGNEQRMNITDDLREIFLSERVRKLDGCFAAVTRRGETRRRALAGREVPDEEGRDGEEGAGEERGIGRAGERRGGGRALAGERGTGRRGEKRGGGLARGRGREGPRLNGCDSS